jgi:hypothetical protein
MTTTTSTRGGEATTSYKFNASLFSDSEDTEGLPANVIATETASPGWKTQFHFTSKRCSDHFWTHIPRKTIRKKRTKYWCFYLKTLEAMESVRKSRANVGREFSLPDFHPCMLHPSQTLHLLLHLSSNERSCMHDLVLVVMDNQSTPTENPTK